MFTFPAHCRFVRNPRCILDPFPFHYRFRFIAVRCAFGECLKNEDDWCWCWCWCCEFFCAFASVLKFCWVSEILFLNSAVFFWFLLLKFCFWNSIAEFLLLNLCCWIFLFLKFCFWISVSEFFLFVLLNLRSWISVEFPNF